MKYFLMRGRGVTGVTAAPVRSQASIAVINSLHWGSKGSALPTLRDGAMALEEQSEAKADNSADTC
ncbi:MAG: hypothetical protein GY765_12985 [bacterium]|nr:hypothetical protein [bacterium]